MNKYLVAASLAFFLFEIEACAMDYEKAPVIVLEIDGSHAAAINVAISNAKNKGIDIGEYQITLMETASAWIVAFAHRNVPRGFRGSPPGMPGYDITLRKKDLAVITEAFSR